MVNIFKVKDKFKLFPLIFCILIPVAGGLLVGAMTKNSPEIYGNLTKTIIFPPALVFPIVWLVLYLLMGVSVYRIYMQRENGVNVGSSLFFYFVQLLLNFLWPLVFFSLRLYGLGLILIILLFVMVMITLIKFFKVDRIAAALLLPYTIWLIYSGVLNYFIWALNEM